MKHDINNTIFNMNLLINFGKKSIFHTKTSYSRNLVDNKVKIKEILH